MAKAKKNFSASEVYDRYLTFRALDNREHVVTIADVDMETLKNEDEEDDEGREMLAAKFAEFPKLLVLNKTNAMTLVDLFGDWTGEWIGRKVTIYPTEVAYKGEMKGCIRIRTKAPAETKTKRSRQR